MPQVCIRNRCAEKIDAGKQDWIIVSMDTARNAGLETRARAECEVKRLKDIQMKGLPAVLSVSGGIRAQPRSGSAAAGRRYRAVHSAVEGWCR
jgi:hypothetical protein